MNAQERHTCHAAKCPVQVPPRMFACRVHWSRVPKAIQTLIWRYYREGQEVDKRPSTAYLAVQQLAVAYLALFDGERAREPIDRATLRREGEIALSNARNWSLVAGPVVESECQTTWTMASRAAWPVWRDAPVPECSKRPAAERPAPAAWGEEDDAVDLLGDVATFDWGPGNT